MKGIRLPRGKRPFVSGLVAGLVLLGVAGIGGGAYATLGKQSALNVAGSAPNTLADGLVGYYKFDDGQARDALPAQTGVSRSGTFTTGADRKGRAGGALNFDGTSNKLTLSNSTTYQFLRAGNANFAFNVWVKTSKTGNQVILDKRSAGPSRRYQLSITSTGAVNGTIMNGGPTGVSATTTDVTANDGAWHMLSMSVNRNSGGNAGNTLSVMQIFVDGVLKASVNVVSECFQTNNCDGSNSPTIGSDSASTTTLFQGSMDDFRFYNRRLSQSDINTLYGTYNPITQPDVGAKGLVGQWKMDGNGNDATPYSSNLSLQAGVSSAADRKNAAAKSLSFNGNVNSYAEVADKPLLNSTTGTWIVWVKTASSASSGSRAFMSKASSTSSTSGITFTHTSTNRWSVRIRNAAGDEANLSGPAAATADTNWHMLALTFVPSGNAVLNVDGVTSGGVAVPAGWSFGSGNPLRFGRSTDGNWVRFSGLIDDARIYNRVLSTDEIQAIYASYNSVIQPKNLPTITP